MRVTNYSHVTGCRLTGTTVSPSLHRPTQSSWMAKKNTKSKQSQTLASSSWEDEAIERNSSTTSNGKDTVQATVPGKTPQPWLTHRPKSGHSTKPTHPHHARSLPHHSPISACTFGRSTNIRRSLTLNNSPRSWILNGKLENTSVLTSVPIPLSYEDIRVWEGGNVVDRPASYIIFPIFPYFLRSLFVLDT